MLPESLGQARTIAFGTQQLIQENIMERIVTGITIGIDDVATVNMKTSSLEIKLNQNGNKVLYNNIALDAIQGIGNLKKGLGLNNAAGIAVNEIYVDLGVIVLKNEDRLSVDLVLINKSIDTETNIKLTAHELDIGINMPKCYIGSNVSGIETFRDNMNLYLYNGTNGFYIGSHDDNLVIDNLFGSVVAFVDDLINMTVVENRVELLEELRILQISKSTADFPIAQTVTVRVNGDFSDDTILFISENYVGNDPGPSVALSASRMRQMYSQISLGFKNYMRARSISIKGTNIAKKIR